MNVVSAPLPPLRRAVLEQLREPLPATEVATRLGESRQRVNGHVRALEEAGLVELVAERRRRGRIERVVRATADAVVVEPAVVGSPAEQDRFAADALRRRRAERRRGARAAPADVRDRGRGRVRAAVRPRAFRRALADRIAELAEEFGPGGRRYRVLAGGHPA